MVGVARVGCEGGDDGLGRQAGAVLCYFPLSGLASFSKERGLGRRGVSKVHLHTNATLILHPCTTHDWPGLSSSRLVGRRRYIYSCDLLIAQTYTPTDISQRRTEHFSSHRLLTCSRCSGPRYKYRVLRIIRCQSSHLHHAVPFSVHCHAPLCCRRPRQQQAARRTPRSYVYSYSYSIRAWMLRMR